MKKIKEINKENNPKFNKIKIGLIILFVITILSLVLGLWTVVTVARINKTPDFLFNEIMWVLWLWLPIPIASIILGFIYKKKGVKCTKNIVAGFIVGLVLLSFGAFTIIYDYEVFYTEIYNYKYVIGLEFPTKGRFMKQKWETSHLEEHTTNYIIFEDEIEINKFNLDIINSDNWLLKENVSSVINTFIPELLVCNKSDICYYSVYFKDFDSYNTVPSESGKYQVYAMMYSTEITTLRIEEYILEYQK